MNDLNAFKNLSALLITACLGLTSCTKSSSDTDDKGNPPQKPTPDSQETKLIRSDYKAEEITKLCTAAIAKATRSLDAIANLAESDRTTENTLLALENTTAGLGDETNPLTFMGYVSKNEAISAEGSECETQVGQFYVQIFTRRDLYQAIAKAEARNPNEARLLQKTLEGFEQNGLKLSDADLAKVRDLKGKLAALETQFSTNLNNDKTTVLFTKDELDGMSADFLATLKVDASGKLIVRADGASYKQVMESAKSADTRKKMMLAYLNRAGKANSDLLSQAVVLRGQIANLMGFQTWADYRTSTRMAKTGEAALDFLNGLKGKLAQRNQDDMDRLLKFKQETIAGATTLDQWDISYYSTQLQKRDYSLDHEKVKEYLPASVVVAGMFELYSKVLGLKYEQVTNTKMWSEDVKLYAIKNAADGKLIGYFYADFFPRPGKYGHAAAFPLISGRVLPDGSYSVPVASIVSNFAPPMNGKPSLLSHDDVETMFHEFGHIMHQTITRAPYASLSGTSVAQDFVEAPSQMLENWVWSPAILNMISGHYQDHSKKLPADLLKQMLAAQNFNQGLNYTKQLTYALFDMTLHTQGQALDVTETYLEIYRQVMGQEPLEGQNFPASFGHMMGGYDAGYYGYLWSEVYAQDMFTQFPQDDLLNAEVGARYRKTILEMGSMKDAIDLIRDFLGREPNSDAFFKKLGL